METVLKLPVINTEHRRLADDLSALDVGEVRFDRHNQLLYATDASLYQVQPIGVVIPKSVDQIARLVGYCRDQKISLLPRGGGTSLAGQCTGPSVVLDLSANFRGIVSVDAGTRRCVVEPGVVIDTLNRELVVQTHRLFFAPDPATIAQATIGGCIGNNAAGARSIRYGRTSENLAGVDVMLSTGERVWLRAGAGRANATAARLAHEVANVVREYAAQIRERFPKTIRRNAGYGLDLILQQLDRDVADDDLDLSGLICGSEGTLAVVIAAELMLHPLPMGSMLAIVSFASVAEAIDSVVPILGTKPSAVELLDDVVLEAARGNVQCEQYLRLLPPAADGTSPQAVLYVEYQATESSGELDDAIDRLKATVPDRAINAYRDLPSMAQAWTLRKSGEALLHGLSSSKKPVTFVEDNAIPVENLSRFVKEFKEIVTRHGTIAAYYAHASVGVLHVRPMIDLRDAEGLQKMQSIAIEVADLARACGGVMSGEHGDGKARGPLLERFYGPELMRAFRQIKRIFDPAGILNPGNMTEPGPVESITQSLRVQAERADDVDGIETYFDYHDQEGFRSAVEMCNGAGFCRKTAGGAMCPSYRATLDERHSTRGRGNALRLAITGQMTDDGPAWDDAGTVETLDLCLSCKACKTECPSNVDISRLKAEYTAQRFKTHGTPLAARVFGHVRKLNQLGSIAPAFANWMAGRWFVRAVLDPLLGLAPERTLPLFSASLYRWFKRRNLTVEKRPRVVLYADCFTTYSEPEIGKAAVAVAEAFGYAVEMPVVGCCGRAMISTGLLADAIASADRTLAVLERYVNDDSIKAIIVCEPSCLSAMKDDWLQLKLATPMELRRKLAAKAMLPETFVERLWDSHPLRPAVSSSVLIRNGEKNAKPQAAVGVASASGDCPSIVVHGHCHQKALWVDDTSAVLKRFAGDRVTTLASGCCGMAGSFGYAADKYELSMKIGELSVFGPVRASDDDVIIAANGTSCRHQIHDGTGRRAQHPIEIIAQLMGLIG